VEVVGSCELGNVACGFIKRMRNSWRDESLLESQETHP